MNEKDKRMCVATESMAVSLNTIANTLVAFQEMFTVMLQHAAQADVPVSASNVKASWDHAQCAKCWNDANPDRATANEDTERDSEKCCFCGMQTQSGIFVRHDPRLLICQGKH
jgi:hypothetical protein